MTPLIDSDVLLHEIGWSAEFKDKDTGESVLFEFDKVEELLNDKIELICQEVGATEEPILFLSCNDYISDKLEIPFVPNFRYEVAKTKPYKGNRNNPKPFHFYNIIAYILANYNYHISDHGLEADDVMCIYQTSSNQETIICSRDKDLRICPGWHYSWECGKQRAVGPHYTDRLGMLTIGNNGKTLGYGLKMFFYQMLVGDTADNIPGLPGIGDAKAFKLLGPLETEEEMYELVKSMYKAVMGEDAKNFFQEQSALLWMHQHKQPKYKFVRTTNE